MFQLQFKLTFVTRLDFYNFYHKWLKFDLYEYHLGLYLLELSLVDPRIKNFCQNNVAASTVYLVK
jgi:hypothetical protein